MKLNPFINAILASAYILGIGFLINHISKLHHDTPDNLIGSLTAISLLVLSASIMAFLFFYKPVSLLIENKKEEALYYFLKTVGLFALITFFFVLRLI